MELGRAVSSGIVGSNRAEPSGANYEVTPDWRINKHQDRLPHRELGLWFLIEREVRVNKINWDKLGRVTEPGRYKCFFGFVTVTPDDIDVWTRFPGATFTLITQLPNEMSVGEEYRLGAFDIGSPEGPLDSA